MGDPDLRATGVRGRLLSRTLRRVLLQNIREHPELTATAAGVPEFRVPGLDPIRVLLIGSGLAMGYGVRTQQEALTGALARAVHDSGGGRGVTVLNRTRPMRSVEQTVTGLGLVGAPTFDLVVWSPSLFDVLRSPSGGTYRRALAVGTSTIRETARPGARVAICELPSPTEPGGTENIARALVPRYNTALRGTVASLPGVQIAPTPEFSSLRDSRAFSPDYYDFWARMITRSLESAKSLAG